MRLPHDRKLLPYLCVGDLLVAIWQRRGVIRQHRDQLLDDRCWLDDYLVWAMLDDSAPEPSTPPSFEEGMKKCRQFYRCRRAEQKDPMPAGAILDKYHWDDDLLAMTDAQLIDELVRIQEAIRYHRDNSDEWRTADDDCKLYIVLPEKIPADFRLPPEEEFIGEARSPKAGCPAFWRSHANCPKSPHDLHRWGPCQ